MNRRRLLTAVCLPLSLALTAPLEAASFLGLGRSPDDDLASALDVAVAGPQVTVVGWTGQDFDGWDPYTRYSAFRWTPDGGMVDLGGVPGILQDTMAHAVSTDGSTVVGAIGSLDFINFFATPVRWTAEGGIEPLGEPANFIAVGSANGLSADASVVVGRVYRSSIDVEAFRWTEEGGEVGLGFLPSGRFPSSEASGVSADGSVIAGTSTSLEADYHEAFRWTDETGMVGLGDLPGGQSESRANGISADGSVIVGASSSQLAPLNEAYRWTAEGGMIGLGLLPGANQSTAHAVSGDGSTVVGQSSGAGFGAFVWDQANGMRRLEDVLTDDYGLDLDGWTFNAARGISGDGTVIVGEGSNPAGDREAWVAVLTEPVLASAADGDWHDAATFNGGGVKPSAIHDVRIGPHAVAMARHGAASLLSIGDPAARLAVGPTGSLSVVNDVEVSAGTLGIAGGGRLAVGGDLVMQAASEYSCGLGGGPGAMISVSGRAQLHGTLALYAAGPLKDAHGQATWGDLTRTILDVQGPGGRSGVFTNDQAVGDDLGHGMVFGDRHGRGLIYTDQTVEVAVFQAAPGDTDGDRIVNSFDIMAIIASNSFPNMPLPPGLDRWDWQHGDFDGNAIVNSFDIMAILAANLFGEPPYAAVDPSAAVDPGVAGKADVKLILDPDTGELIIDTDDVTISGYIVASQQGILTGDPAVNLGLFQEDTDTLIGGTMGFRLLGEHWLGSVIHSEAIDPVDPFADLTLTYTVEGVPGTFAGNLVVVPEPGTLLMLAAGTLGLLWPAFRRWES